jgi:predicted nucleic acid-binding protein
MKRVFVDTSGFYAILDSNDPFHESAVASFERAGEKDWSLWTTNYVVHETCALVQHRLGWDAVDHLLDILLPVCEIEYVDRALHSLGELRCRRERLRRLSLTDCVSLEFMRLRLIAEAIASDDHFTRSGVKNP